MIILRWHSSDPHLHMSDNSTNNSAKLDIRKLLANAPMSAGTKGLVRGVGALGHEPETIVDLCGLVLVLEGGADGAVGCRRVSPARGQPLVVVSPHAGVHLRDKRRSKDEVPRWDDVLTVFGGCCKGRWDEEVLFHFTLWVVQNECPSIKRVLEMRKRTRIL